MHCRNLFGLIALAAMPLGRAAAQTDDSKVSFINQKEVSRAFAMGRPLIEVGDYKIHASRREGPGIAEIHFRDTDIIYVLQSSAALVTGGTTLDAKPIGPEELRGSAITGGQTRQVQAGDIVVIPNGVAHWFKEVKPPFLYYVVKVRQPRRQAGLGAMR